jgi:D-alanyl-D-alanine carboxypeptidase/D-alanyl-D-alanine-endopeptidase (penicillin-binding protein 4)
VAWADTPGALPPGTRLLARRLSRPWGELLRMMNKQSDNPSTRLLFLSLGLAAMADAPGVPTAELAQRAVQAWLAEHRIGATGLVLDNGSGLSRSERISPRQLAQLLQAALAGRWAPELMMSLPVAGVDGSLRNRLKTGPATGWARLKGGTLKDVTALAGVVPDAQGRLWVLAAMVNHEQAAAARPALDALVDWVARGGMAGR